MRKLMSFFTIVCIATTAFAHRPVAHWDVVPFQIVDSTMKLGVAAFHVDGVEVEFRVNNTLVYTAEDPTYNDRTDVWEFWFNFDASGYSDGAVTIDAKAVPQNATDASYDLDTITMYANSGGSLTNTTITYADSVNGLDTNAGTEASPYQTLAMAVSNTTPGGTVYLKAGTYSAASLGGGNSRDYWTTISAAPGVIRSDVIVTEGRPSTQRLRWNNLKLVSTSTSGTYSPILTGNGTTTVHHVWVDDIEICNVNGRYAASTNIFNNGYVAYITDCHIHNVTNGPGGRLLRGIEMDTITSDAWSGSNRLVVNCTVTDIDPGTTGAHPDFHQSYPGSEDWFPNSILYNVSGYDCNSQGLFGLGLKDSAFVNVLFERRPNVDYTSQYGGDMQNVIFAHVDIIGQSFRWRGVDPSGYNADGVYVLNCLFTSMSILEDGDPSNVVFDYNHFISGTNFGTNYTTGAINYLDPSTSDYSLYSNSPAYGTGMNLQCVPADIEGNAFNTSARNKGCYAGGTIYLYPPEADAGPDQITVDSDYDDSETVVLDASASSDFDGTIQSYVWTENSSQIATGANPAVSLSVGTHSITLTITDDDSNTDTDTVTIVVNEYGASAGQTYYIDGHTDDTQVTSILSAGWNGGTSCRVGGSTSTVDGALITVFELPVFGSGEFADSATVDVYLNTIANSPQGNVDLYGLGYRDDSAVLGTDFYQGSFDGDSTDAWALQDDFATLSSSAGWISSTSAAEDDIADYIQDQIDAGAESGDFIFLRLNPDADDVSSYYYWEFATADSTNVPQLTITTVGTDIPVASAGSDQTVTDSDNDGYASVTLDGSASADSDGTIVSYLWTENSAAIATGSQPAISLAVGTHTITLSVTDNNNATDTDTVVITVEEDDHTYYVYGHDDDKMARSDGSTGWVGESSTRVGGATSTVDGAHIYVFELPELETDQYVASATLEAYLNTIANNPGGNVDLYGLGYRSTSTVLGTDFYQGVFDGDTTDAWAIQDDFATISSSTASWLVSSASVEDDLGAYIQAQFNAGATAGDYIFLRVNPDADDVTSYYYWEFATADSANVPLLTIVAGDDVAPVADAGSDQDLTDSDADGYVTVSLDGSNSSDSDGTITSYIWKNGDTQVANTASANLSLDIGLYTLDLNVTDDVGVADTDSVDIAVYSRTLTGAYSWPENVLPSQTGSFTVEFDLTANLSNVDCVTGLAYGAADWWNELACIVRLNDSGYIDVRDGSSYSYDTAVSYAANDSFHFEMIVDVPNVTYSVYVTPDGGSRTLLAEDYAFRTEQASITSIDHWTLNDTNDESAQTVSNLTITE